MKRVFFPLLLAAACSSPSSNTPEEKPPAHPVRSCTAVVRSSSADAVSGEFTDWEEVDLVDGKAEFEGLAAGDYAYALLKDGEVVERIPRGTPTKWFDGSEYFALQVGDCHQPTWDVDSAIVEDSTLKAKLFFVSANDGAKLDPTSVRVTVAGEEVSVQADAETGAIIVERPLDAFGKVTLRASASDADGNATQNQLWLPLWHEEEPWTWQDALLYLVFTDRFRDTDGQGASAQGDVEQIAAYQGGDFAGVEQAIEEGYFDELGVNALWLSPVYDNPEAGYIGSDGVHNFTGYHGYWPIDFLTAEPKYGGDEALHSLIRAAHARGIRIVFDIVLNHVHEDHTYCSEKPEWCAKTCVCGTDNCGWEPGDGGRPRDCQFAPYLPDLDYRNHDIVLRVVDDLFTLAAKFDVDGLRIDAAKHMDRVILRSIRRRTGELEDQGATPFWLVGETFTGDRGEIMEYVSDDELHGQFDFPLFYAIRGTFAHGGSFRDLEGAAAAGQREYGAFYPWMSPFLGNHDLERFVSAAAGNVQGGFENTPDLMGEGGDEVTQWDLVNKMSMAYAFLLTQPGVPLIYYGDEVGLAGGPDPDNRRMMPSGLNANRLELLARVQQLGKLRREILALRHGGRKELWLGDDFYVYVRDAGPGEAAIVAMNKSGETRTESVSIPNALGLSDATFESRNSTREFRVIDGKMNVELDPWEYAILTPR